MKKINDLIKVLPITFQNSKVVSKYKIKDNRKDIVIKNIGSESKESSNFYKPISKIFLLDDK